ncbi:upstream of flc-like protein [Tanacetum coccineum]
MEGQVGVGANNNDGGQVIRRVHIVYYLSRNGRIEHPHLIRIHHVSRSGIHLRDVKSWLSELRGMDMPESFAWSYKRLYKGSYVWQDLLDEDLITPICDNEYVLKGSEISSKTSNNGVSAYSEKEVFELEKSSHFEVNLEDPKYRSLEKEYALDFSTNTSIEIEESSFGSNVTTDDKAGVIIKNQDEYKEEKEGMDHILKDKNEHNSFYETSFNKNTNDNNYNNNKCMKSGNQSVKSYFKAPLPTYSLGESGRLSSSRALHMFRNWITCGTNDTHEKAVVVINKRNGVRTSTVSSVSEKTSEENNMGPTYKEQKFRGFEKSYDGKSGSKKSMNESRNYKTSAAAYKPVNGPNCAQCGRQFNPEKLHKHMQYCRGMKAFAKSANSRPKPKISTHSAAPIGTFLLDK